MGLKFPRFFRVLFGRGFLEPDGKVLVMSDAIIAAVRTAVQAGITFLAAWLLARGIVLDPAIEAALMTIAIGAVTLILNKLQEKFPWLGQILSLGMSSNAPSYK